MKSDWKKVAAKRLEAIRCLERESEYLRQNLTKTLERELRSQFHAHCIQRQEFEHKLRGIAEFVAERVRPKLP